MNKNFKAKSIGMIASVIAGAYYLYGSKEGEARRKEIKAWSLKLKGEVLQGLEKLKEVTEPKYKEVIQKVSEKYKSVDKGELKKVVVEMLATWNKMKAEIQKEVEKRAEQIKEESKEVVKSAKKTVKRKSK